MNHFIEHQEDIQHEQGNELAEREAVAQANRDSMSRVLGESGVQVRPSELNKWRPTEVVRGTIVGMPVESEILATDGNLGIFRATTEEGHNLGKYFIGHVQWFEWAGEGEGKGAPPALHGRRRTSEAKAKDKVAKPKESVAAKKSRILASL